jgi:hypothetical protein
VQQHLEPQLVDLVDDDEEQLVVLGAARQRLLAGEELVDMQVRRVGDGALLQARSLDRRRPHGEAGREAAGFGVESPRG